MYIPSYNQWQKIMAWLCQAALCHEHIGKKQQQNGKNSVAMVFSY